MALCNALLVRYATGYVWVTDATSIAAYERREGYLALGAIESSAEATRIGNAVLAERKDPAIAIRAGLEPSGAGDTPFSDFEEGEYITAPDEHGTPSLIRVKAITVAEDGQGNPTFAPELQTLTDERDQTLQRWLKTMANGTVGGSIASASPPPPIFAAEFSNARIFGLLFIFGTSATPAAVTTATNVQALAGASLLEIIGVLTTPGSTPTTFVVYVNGSLVGSVTLAGGARSASATLSTSITATATMSAGITVAGAGAAGASVLIRAAANSR